MIILLVIVYVILAIAQYFFKGIGTIIGGATYEDIHKTSDQVNITDVNNSTTSTNTNNITNLCATTTYTTANTIINTNTTYDNPDIKKYKSRPDNLEIY